MAATLPNLVLPCSSYEELPGAMDVAASSFLTRYDQQLWPGKDTSATSSIRQAVQGYFYSLLRLPAKVPVNPELTTFLAHSLLLKNRHWPAQAGTSSAQLEQDQQAMPAPRRSSLRSYSAPSLPKPEWPLENDVVETEDLTDAFESLELDATGAEEEEEVEEEVEETALLRCKVVVRYPDVECREKLNSEAELLEHYRSEHDLDNDCAREMLAEVLSKRSTEEA